MKKRLSIAAIAAAIALCTACAGKPAPAPSSSAPDLSTEPDLLIPYTEQELVLPACNGRAARSGQTAPTACGIPVPWPRQR